MRLKRLLATALLVVCVLFNITTPLYANEISVDKDGTYTSAVFDTSQDAGKLTARYLHTTGSRKTTDDVTYAGDCTVFTSPEGLIMVIDCSNSWNFEEIDIQLQRMGVKQIDIFVMSHPHADHIGSFVQLASKYPIGHIYKNAHEYESTTYQNAMDKVRQLKIPCEILYTGDSFMFGDRVSVKVYGPDEGAEENVKAGYMTANDLSLAMKITFDKSSFWTSGDLYITKELDLVERFGDELKSDVMKMNHHGYDTSNNSEFIATVNPKVAVQLHSLITNRTIAMKFHLKQKALTFYTSQDGSVSVSTTGDGTYEVQTQYIRQITNMYGKPSANGHYSIRD
jgi:beta-lactamase superfamily II metal-dependent hydrolase